MAAALELFAAKGYEATSASEIASRAGVSEMTFFRHFPTKSSLLVDDPYDPMIGEAIRAEPHSLEPIARAARGIGRAWRELAPPSTEQVRVRLRIVAQTPALRAALAGGTAATEAVIVEALTEGGVEPAEAVVVAGAVMGGLNAALLEWSRSDGDLGQAIVGALRILEGGHG